LGALLLPSSIMAQKQTLAVSAVKPIPALVIDVTRNGKLNSLNRVVESLDGQLINSLNATRKFELVSRSDLNHVIQEQGLAGSGNVDANDTSAAKQAKLAGAKYLIVTTVDNFEDKTETLSLDGGRTISATKRTIKLSVVAKIYDSTTGKLLESATVPCRQMNPSESDDPLLFTVREASDRLSTRIVDVIFPAKVLIKRDKQITINRGDGTGIAIGQVWNVFQVGEELIDPDTKESLGHEEVLIGRARVISVQPKTSTADLLEDNGVDKGAVLRLPPGAAMDAFRP
jgi:hypothetical protein